MVMESLTVSVRHDNTAYKWSDSRKRKDEDLFRIEPFFEKIYKGVTPNRTG